MTTGLQKLLNFCVDHELLDADSSNRIACEFDRYQDNISKIVIDCGVDERKLYEVAAMTSGLNLVSLNQICIDKDVFNCITLDKAIQLSCIPVSINAAKLAVVTCEWSRLEVVQKGMENLTGKKIDVDLVSYTDFQNLHCQLVDH